MQDRVSKYPGRVTLIPVQGLENTYTMKRADEPTQPGTPLNKSTLLTDATANLMGGAVQTPDDAFKRLLLLSQTGGMVTVHVTPLDESPVGNLLVTGISDIDGNPVFTSSDGRAVGIATAGSRTIGISGYADVVDATQSIEIENGSMYELELRISSRNYLNISSSRKVMFSDNVETIDYSVVGGGGGATGRNQLDGGCGGGGGAVQSITGASVTPHQFYDAVVGAGGKAVNFVADDGGASSFLDLTCPGGEGGGRNDGGKGGSPNGGDGGDWLHPGTDGGTRFSSFFKTKRCSGGGAGGGDYDGVEQPGEGGGGTSGKYGGNGGDGTEPGAGGGGGGQRISGGSNKDNTYGGDGHAGCIDIRMHLKQGG